MRQDASVDRIGFRQLPRGLGEIARLPRVDDDHRQACGGQLGGKQDFQAAGGLQHDAFWIQGLEARQKRRELVRSMSDTPGFSRRTNGDVEMVFRNINPNRSDFHRGSQGTHSCEMRAQGPGNCSSYFRTELATSALWRFQEPRDRRSTSSGECPKYCDWTTDGTYKGQGNKGSKVDGEATLKHL